MGLDPRSPGSRPGLKAGAKPLSHQGYPVTVFRAHLDNSDNLPMFRSLITRAKTLVSVGEHSQVPGLGHEYPQEAFPAYHICPFLP